MKKFLYLVQCREDLRGGLSALRGEQSDVVLLSWRRPAKGAIFFPFSTYNQGRNRLFAETRGKDYLYYIFVDEDVRLKLTRPCKTLPENPWRVFERYLSEFEPAVGVTWTSWQPRGDAEVEAVDFFDLILNAVHKDAIDVILPYDELNDKRSWWCSTIYVNHLAYLLYPGHILQFNCLKAENTVHMPYPRGKKHWVEVDRTFKQSILDDGFKKDFHPFLSEFRRYPVKKKDRSYVVGIDEIKRLFDVTAPYWRQRIKWTEVNGRNRGLSYQAERLHRKYGPTAVKVFFEIPLLIKELYTKKFFYWTHWHRDGSPF